LIEDKGYSREEAIEEISLDGYYAICSFNKNGAEKEFGNMKWQTYGFIQKPHVEKLTTLMEYLDKI
jgi:hypothetical protein